MTTANLEALELKLSELTHWLKQNRATEHGKPAFRRAMLTHSAMTQIFYGSATLQALATRLAEIDAMPDDEVMNHPRAR